MYNNYRATCSKSNRLFWLLVLLLVNAAGADIDPITDKVRLEVVTAQRDYLLAKQQLDQAANQLRVKIAECEKVCGEKKFDIQSLTCVEKPASDKSSQK